MTDGTGAYEVVRTLVRQKGLSLSVFTPFVRLGGLSLLSHLYLKKYPPLEGLR